MASISKESNGRKTIQFVGGDRKRKSIRLGKVTQRDAEHFRLHVERLVAAAIHGGSIPRDTAIWLRDLPNAMHDRLAAVDLVEARGTSNLGEWIGQYIDSRTDAKPSTVITYKRARNKLLTYFGTDKPLRTITAGDADEFVRWLRDPEGGGLAKATAAKTTSIAKQFFRAAVRKKLIPENPFADHAGTVPANRERDYFVSIEETAAVLEAAPDAEWRALIALSRFGGLRVPSEALALTWGDIDWHNGRMTVRSPKTEHHEGGASRTVPLFPELRAHLMDAFSVAGDGETYVIARYRDSTVNLRTRLMKTIRRAKLEPWPKLWANMRATRATELNECFAPHVVSSWLGHSKLIAEKHYLQVTEDHFKRALQNPVHYPVRMGANASEGGNGDKGESPVYDALGRIPTNQESLEMKEVGGKGLEPLTLSV
jgi:integrase